MYHCWLQGGTESSLGADSRTEKYAAQGGAQKCHLYVQAFGYKHTLSRKYCRTFTRERKLWELCISDWTPFF